MFETVCIRCGKTRILARKWEEKSGKGSIVFHEETVCPDSQCQELVDAKFEEMRERKRNLTNRG